jgi:GTP-binding protein HflX
MNDYEGLREHESQGFSRGSAVEKPQAVLVECLVPGYISKMSEVKSLMEAMGYEIVQTIHQRRGDYTPGLCIGRGKVEEISEIVNRRKVAVVAFANMLTGGQVLRIQRMMGEAKVLDRNLVILELFEKRARTSEAKLQIALAKLLYTYGWGRESIRRKGIEQEQVGVRGPGGYPFSAYEADVRRRVSKLRDELRRIRKHKEMLRVRRSKLGYPVVALAGYTQSGKTTFFNRIVTESKEVGLGPFTTLSTSARRFKLQSGREVILVDAIGFVEDMHPLILEAFKTTLTEISSSDLILLFIDISEDDALISRKASATRDIIREVAPSTPLVICANKLDLVGSGKGLHSDMSAIRRNFKERIVPLSAKTGENVKLLLDLIDDLIEMDPRRMSSKGPP